MIDIFLSYSSADLDRVRPIVDGLKRQGWSVWWDRTLLPGQTWEKMIEAALDAARCVVVLWSHNSVASDWVKTEATEGKDRGILVPALIDPVKLPLAFRQSHAANLVGWSGQVPHPEFDALVQAIQALLGTSAAAASGASAPVAAPPAVQPPPRPVPAAPPAISPPQPSVPPTPEPAAQGHHWLGLGIPAKWPLLGLGLLLAATTSWVIFNRPSVPKPQQVTSQTGKAETRQPETQSVPQEHATVAPKTRVPDPSAQNNASTQQPKPNGPSGPNIASGALEGRKDEKPARAPASTAKETQLPASPGTVRVNPKDGLRYVYIPAGKFQMGCSPGDTEFDADEKPAHAVQITKGYWLGQTEVTQGAYRKVTGKSPSSYFKGEDWPVEQVSWEEAAGYCTAVGLRLPTEAEWEYAARAGTTGARYRALDRVAWYRDNSGGGTKPVAGKQPNSWGLYDMLGNVSEWTADYWAEKYPGGAEVDPKGPSGGSQRVLRGGSWYNNTGVARASDRSRGVPTDRSNDNGFRCGGELR